ncbi:MAG: TonB-dependent receptor [Phenylobacterium sp.]|uniref:TonB-dependent receptor domain-containing protein n=1 Tax=Phenylobacterium sp. TaxID=1871053 RepID=UPI00271E9C9A|nr:TonB-dependent receptor [Phenylobacterium sp.]MDO9430988.1 TonB-dependent receptor [Phenylobacterium sp.]
MPLDRALTAFSVQSDRDILFTPGVVAGLRSRAVSGRLDSTQALTAMLLGSGLTWRDFQGHFLIERAPPAKGEDAVADVEGVVVTALRRPTLEQLTPMSMRALSGDELRRAGAATFEDAVAMLPGLSQTSTGVGRSRLSLRGVYGSGEATTALYYDDVPVTGPSGTTADPGGSFPEFLLVDVQQIELLRGPQGTLYGASAMGGAFKVMFNRPDLAKPSVTLEAEASVNDGVVGDAQTIIVNQPLVGDKLGLRLAAYRRAEPPFARNARLGLSRTNASEAKGFRLGVGAQPTDDLQLNLTLAHQDATDDDTGASALGGPAHVSENYMRTPFESRMTLYDGSANWRVGGVHVTAMAAGYRWDSTRQIEYTGVLLAERRSLEGCQRYLGLPLGGACTPAELDGYSAYVDSRAPGLLNQPINLTARVGELRVQSETPGFVAWTAGLFHEVREDTIDSQVVVGDPASGLPLSSAGFTGRRIVDSRLNQRAVYGEVTLGADRDTSLSLGARRFEYDKRTEGKALVVNVISNTSEANFLTTTQQAGWSLKFVGSHRFSPALMGYVQAAQGFRPGGINTVPGLPPDLAAYDADSLWNYEAGLKSVWLGSRLVINATVYRIDWRDMQYSANSTNGAFAFITNLGQARVLGLEADTIYTVSPAWRGGLNLSLTDAVLTKDQATNDAVGLGSAGDRIPVIPRLAAGGWVEYRRDLGADLELLARADASYIGVSHSAFDNGGAANVKLGDLLLLNVRASLRAQAWTLGAFVDNILDSDRPTFATSARQPQVSAPRPRRFGLSAIRTF